MTKTQKTIVLAVVGFFAMLVITVVVVGVWAFRSMVDNSPMDETSAAKVMEDVRVRFQHAPPVLDLRPGALMLARRPPDTQPANELKTLHILRWDIHEQRLSRVEVPFWLLRLSDDPIDVIIEAEANEGAVRMKKPSSVTVSDIERFGPALLLDGDMPDGGRLLVWSE
jgi:hypothetical protein